MSYDLSKNPNTEQISIMLKGAFDIFKNTKKLFSIQTIGGNINIRTIATN